MFERVAYENPHPHLRFCENALDEGYEVWAVPSIEVLHLDPQKVGITKTPLEVLKGEAFDPPPYIKKDGSIVTNEMFSRDLINAFIWGIVE